MTIRRWLLAPAAVVVIVLASCTGCMRACAGGNIPVPAVWLDASPWLAAHPGESLDGCFAGRCQNIDARQAVVQLIQANADLGRPELFTVSTNGADPRRLVNEHVALKEFIQPTACGDVQYWGLNARVSADGRVAILGWSNSRLRAATTVPMPSTTVPMPSTTRSSIH